MGRDAALNAAVHPGVNGGACQALVVGGGMAGLAAERKCAVNSCNIQQDTSGDVRPGARATGLGGSVAVPVLDDAGRVLGVVGVATRCERTFTTDEERAIAARAQALFREAQRTRITT